MIIKAGELRSVINNLDELYTFLKELEGGNLDDLNIMTMATEQKSNLRRVLSILENLEI